MTQRKEDIMSIRYQLKKINEQFQENASPKAISILGKSAEKLAKLRIEETALKVGDRIPSFTLKNAVGEHIDSADLLEDGPLVINFYRGAWCPYCNVELNGYQDILENIHSKGAQLVAISPELPDNSLSLIEKHELKYEILTDLNNDLAKELGLVFSLDTELKSLYKDFGIDLESAHGNQNYELPVPATYVIDETGTVIMSYVNVDYTDRLEPEEVLTVL